MEEKGKWITIRGNHIFVKEGQSEEDAFNEFLNAKKYLGMKGKIYKESDFKEINDYGDLGLENYSIEESSYEDGGFDIYDGEKKIDSANSLKEAKEIVLNLLNPKKQYKKIDDTKKVKTFRDKINETKSLEELKMVRNEILEASDEGIITFDSRHNLMYEITKQYNKLK